VFTLCRDERLRGKRAIANLFDAGQSFFLAPYKVFWIIAQEKALFPVCFAVSVPKRIFKHAVTRNLIKRRTREAFRINKLILSDVISDHQQVRMMLVYTYNKPLTFAELEESMKKILQRIAKQYEHLNHVEPV